MNNKNKDKVRLKNAGAFFLTPCYRTPAASGGVVDVACGTGAVLLYLAEREIIGERVRPLLMRQTYRSEMFLLAELCGFEVLDIYRGYKGDKEDLNDPSSAAKYRSNLIWILKRKD